MSKIMEIELNLLLFRFQMAGNLNWNLEDKNPEDLTKVRYIQVTFVTNIQPMLEIYISLYELRHSILKDVLLKPSEQFEVFNEHDEFSQKNYVSYHMPSIPLLYFIDSHFPVKFQQSIVDEMYGKCAISVCGGSKILLLNGGVGTGKTTFIRHLLLRFAEENFQFSNSILVCGRNNALVDAMAMQMMNEVKRSNYSGEKIFCKIFRV